MNLKNKDKRELLISALSVVVSDLFLMLPSFDSPPNGPLRIRLNACDDKLNYEYPNKKYSIRTLDMYVRKRRFNRPFSINRAASHFLFQTPIRANS